MLRLEKTLKAGQRKFPPHQVDVDDYLCTGPINAGDEDSQSWTKEVSSSSG